jgi:hypothetical protein
MAMPKSTGRIYRIEGREYAVSISAGKIDKAGDVPVRISMRANFGKRSFSLVRGVTNRSFWDDYPYIEEMRKVSISLTPRIVCRLIALAHARGLSPETSKSSFQFVATRETIRAIGGVTVA